MSTLWTVSVDSEDIHEGQWNDLLLVTGETEEEVKDLALEWVRDERTMSGTAEVTIEAYRYAGSARVLGRMEID